MMTQSTDMDASLKLGLFEVSPEMRPAVDFLGYQVVESEGNPAMAARAGYWHGSAQLFAEGSAASIAARISSLSGFTLLGNCCTTSPAGETRYLLKFQRG